MDTLILKKIFGDNAENSVEIYRMIVDEINNSKHKYFYFSLEAIGLLMEDRNFGMINQRLSYEIVERIYIASLTGYLRQYKWIEGMCQGVKSNNFFLFASAARAFLESTSDYYDALEDIPLNLVCHYKLIKKAIDGEFDSELINFKNFENPLLHFQEANKSNGKNDDNLKPKSAKEYMNSRNLKHLNLYNCYAYLCEITHPAKYSLDFFFDENNYIYTLNNNKDKQMVEGFLQKYACKYSELLDRSENLCIILFKTINKFNIEEFYLHSVERINIDSVNMWNKIESYFNG